MKQRRFILVGAGGFREFWEEIFIPKMKDFAVPVAAVDVSEEALKLPVKYGTVPAEKCYTDPARLDTYAHVTTTAQREAAKKMDGVLGQRVP